MSDRKQLRRLASNHLPKRVDRATEIVAARQDFLGRFTDFDEFIFQGESVDRNAAAAVEHNLRLVRAHLAQILWSNEVFIGIDVIDRILFDLVRSGEGPTIIPSFLSYVQDRGIHRAGFVLYPLHSFGVLGLGFYRFFTKELPQMMAQLQLEQTETATPREPFIGRFVGYSTVVVSEAGSGVIAVPFVADGDQFLLEFEKIQTEISEKVHGDAGQAHTDESDRSLAQASTER